jgi:hypothetical protein
MRFPTFCCALCIVVTQAQHMLATDWLLNPAPFVAKLETDTSGKQLMLSNGLIERRWIISPNAAGIGFRHQQTGETLLRGIKPEARVTIDGETWDIGGLKGQTNYAFLDLDALSELRNDPRAFQFTGYEVNPIRERMPWKPLRRHAPDVRWPPKGVELRLDFAAPNRSWRDHAPSELGRVLLWSDAFATLDEQWKLLSSGPTDAESNAGSSEKSALPTFQADAIPGNIMAVPGSAILAEHTLPENTALVEATLDPGTDVDSSWGPGLGLVWQDQIIEVNLRPGDRGQWGHFELRHGGESRLATVPAIAETDGGLARDRTYRLRARIHDSTLMWDVADADQTETQFYPLFEVACPTGAPLQVRVGKSDRTGNPKRSEHYDASAPPQSCRIRSVRAYGPYDEALVGAAPSQRIRVSVHYELYDGLPCYGKWITVHNPTQSPIRVDSYTSDLLAAVEHTSEVDALSVGQTPPNLHVETDMAMGGMTSQGANRRSYRWVADPDYHTQVNYEKKTPCLLEVGPDLGPSQSVPSNQTWTSYRSWVLVHDATDRERTGLGVRKLFRTLAPWVTENPLMMHLIASDRAAVHAAIDQCHEVGFEMLILSFGSGFDLENRDPKVLATAQSYAQYAASKGIEIGSYSLLASRSVGRSVDVVSPEGTKPVFGNSPCLCSQWGTEYFERMVQFHRDSGFQLLEHDGSYPGDPCASHDHPGHQGLEDSRWNQWQRISEFYGWCRGRGLYLNVPDHYFLSGSNKTGMGYREVNWSLPREQQTIHTRQNIFDGTWQKTPSMGWMFVPLTEYHGGGPKATIEPLDANLEHYRNMLQSNLALGVQACYRGPRLFDTPRTREMVRDQVDWYKRHRDILESDLIHGRRADAQQLDWMLHVNPQLEEKGLLAVFNPLPEPRTETLHVPLYYTGLHGHAQIIDANGTRSAILVDRHTPVSLEITVPGRSMSYTIFQ